MPARVMRPEDLPEVTAMMRALCPDEVDYDFADETVFVWERDDGGLGGFISLSLRAWAEGCHSAPVAYLEGWWIEPDLRRTGAGRSLMEAVEGWCRERNYVELGSDVEPENEASLRAHAALGFAPTLRLQYFRKLL